MAQRRFGSTIIEVLALTAVGFCAQPSAATDSVPGYPVQSRWPAAQGAPSFLEFVSAYTSATTETAFDRDVLQSEQPVLVEFWAPWRAACKAVAPTIDVLAAGMRNRLRVIKVNIDIDPGLAREFGVNSIPSLLLFRDGKLIVHKTGIQPDSLIPWLETLR